MFEKGEKIIQILLKASFTVKKSKVKGPAQKIQFLRVKQEDRLCQIPTDVSNSNVFTNKEETQAFLSAVSFQRMHIPKHNHLVT